MKPELRNDLLYLLRAAAVFVLSAFAAGGVFYMLLLEIRKHQNIVEGGLVESTQLAVLALACVAFAAQARRGRAMPRAFALVALATLAMLVREMDAVFDRALFHGAWFAVDAAVFAAFAAVALRRPEETAGQLARFVRTPQCLLFVAGAVLAVVVAQLIGYKEIWNRIFDREIWNEARATHLLGDGHLPKDLDIARHVKNTVEEAIELGSYLMILAAAVLPPLLRRRGEES